MTPAPLVGVLALQGGFAAHVRVLGSLGAEVREVRVPADLDGLDGLVMPGGESTTMTLGIEREGLAEPLREFVRSGKPTLLSTMLRTNSWPRPPTMIQPKPASHARLCRASRNRGISVPSLTKT